MGTFMKAVAVSVAAPVVIPVGKAVAGDTVLKEITPLKPSEPCETIADQHVVNVSIEDDAPLSSFDVLFAGNQVLWAVLQHVSLLDSASLTGLAVQVPLKWANAALRSPRIFANDLLKVEFYFRSITKPALNADAVILPKALAVRVETAMTELHRVGELLRNAEERDHAHTQKYLCPMHILVRLLGIATLLSALASFIDPFAGVVASGCAVAVAMCVFVIMLHMKTCNPERIHFLKEFGFVEGVKRHWFSVGNVMANPSDSVLGHHWGYDSLLVSMYIYVTVPAGGVAGLLFLILSVADMVSGLGGSTPMWLGLVLVLCYALPHFLFMFARVFMAIYYVVVCCSVAALNLCLGSKEEAQRKAYDELRHALYSYKAFGRAAQAVTLKDAAAKWEALDRWGYLTESSLKSEWFTFARLVYSHAQAIVTRADQLASLPLNDIEVIYDNGQMQRLQVALDMTVTEAIRTAALTAAEDENEFRHMCEVKWHFGGQEIADQHMTLADLGVECGATIMAQRLGDSIVPTEVAHSARVQDAMACRQAGQTKV